MTVMPRVLNNLKVQFQTGRRHDCSLARRIQDKYDLVFIPAYYVKDKILNSFGSNCLLPACEYDKLMDIVHL